MSFKPYFKYGVMENICRGFLVGAVFGMCVGAIVVAKNKKLAGKIREGVTTAEEKLQEAKESLIEKMQSSEEKCVCDCDGNGTNAQNFETFSDKNNFNKKSKN